MGTGSRQIRFHSFLAKMDPLISAQLAKAGEAIIQIELPGTEPPLTLRADPRDPDQARFLALACDISRAAQVAIERASRPFLDASLAAELPEEAPALIFQPLECPPGFTAFFRAMAALCGTSISNIPNNILGYFYYTPSLIICIDVFA